MDLRVVALVLADVNGRSEDDRVKRDEVLSAEVVDGFAELLVLRVAFRWGSWSSERVVIGFAFDVSEVRTDIPRVDGKLVAGEGVCENVVGIGDVEDTGIVEIRYEAGGVHDTLTVGLEFLKSSSKRVKREDAGVISEASEHVFKIGASEGPFRVGDRFGDGDNDVLPAWHVRVL